MAKVLNRVIKKLNPMKKHLKLFMLATLAVITIESCKKDPIEPTVIDSSCKMVKLVGYADGKLDATINFSYETDGKLKSFTDGKDITNYTYNADKIVINENGTIVNVTIANGKAIKLQKVGSTSYQEYTYNADGYLITVKNYDNGVLKSTNALTYTGANISKITYSSNSGTEDIIYEYGTDLNKSNVAVVDPIINNVYDYYIPVEYLGKQNKNVIIKLSSSYSYGTSRSDNSIAYTYVKDSNGNYAGIESNEVYKSYTNNVLNTTNTYNYKYNSSYECK
jgi:hypothetical protein